MIAPDKIAETPGQQRQPRLWLLANRVLFVASLVALVLGAALGQMLITWLNATLL